MTLKEAKKIGGRQGVIAVCIGLLIAQAIMTSLFSMDSGMVRGFFWFIHIEWQLNLLIGVMAMFTCGYLYGQVAGKLILIQSRNFMLIGIATGFSVIGTTSFLAGWTGFFQEGIQNIGNNDNPFFDYIFKPTYWIFIFGIIPSIIVGIWFGWTIKRKGNSKNNLESE